MFIIVLSGPFNALIFISIVYLIFILVGRLTAFSSFSAYCFICSGFIVMHFGTSWFDSFDYNLDKAYLLRNSIDYFFILMILRSILRNGILWPAKLI